MLRKIIQLDRQGFFFVMILTLVTNVGVNACVPSLNQSKARDVNKSVPENFGALQSTKEFEQTKTSSRTYSGLTKWKEFFTDSNLNFLVDAALQNNQELNIRVQEIVIANAEVMSRYGEYLPKVGIGASGGIEKVGKYSSQGVADEHLEFEPGKRVPEHLPNLTFGLSASWEVDVWKKLRNAKKSAVYRYLASIQGRNWVVTRLVSEIARSYYDLMALDNQLEVLKQNIEIQQNALAVVRLQKQAAKVTELAVRRFEAEVLKNQSRQFDLRQRIIQTENQINFLTGRYPQPITRGSENFISLTPQAIQTGIPAVLLQNRPDVLEAELQLEAAKLDVSVAKARFYPSLSIEAGIGYQAFNPKYLVTTPDSLIYNAAANLTMPLINRKAIKALYFSANANQIQAVYNYERTLLNAYTEVVNQLNLIDNLKKSYELKSKQVDALKESVTISTVLFKSARADYMEVLLTRRDALDSQMELIETKKQQLTAMVNTYQALGGGWR